MVAILPVEGMATPAEAAYLASLAEAAALTRAAAALEDAPPPSTAENVAAAMDLIRWLTSPGAWVPGARVLDVVEGR